MNNGVALAASVPRVATPEDWTEIWRMFLQAHEENGLFRLAPEKVDFFIQRALRPDLIHPNDTGPRGQIVVIGEPGHLQAICFVLLGAYWYSHERHLEELLVFVDSPYRNSGHAKALIEWMKKTSVSLGLRLITGIMSTERTEAKVRLYRRQLTPIGAFFMHPAPSTRTAAPDGVM